MFLFFLISFYWYQFLLKLTPNKLYLYFASLFTSPNEQIFLLWLLSLSYAIYVCCLLVCILSTQITYAGDVFLVVVVCRDDNIPTHVALGCVLPQTENKRSVQAGDCMSVSFGISRKLLKHVCVSVCVCMWVSVCGYSENKRASVVYLCF